MTNTQTHIDIHVCSDCYQIHHYGAFDHYDDDERDALRETECQIAYSQECETFELADNTDAETGKGIDAFSKDACDICGIGLAGYRFRLAGFPITYGTDFD